MQRKYLIIATIFALLNMGAIFLIFGFRWYGDSAGLSDTINKFLDRGEVQPYPWILRPLGPVLALPFEFLGTGAGLIIQNVIFYLLSAFLIFKIVALVYREERQALFALLFFAASAPVIEYGLAYLTDMGAWFFYILSVFLTLLYFKNKNEKLIILNGFLSGVGVLMKENGGLGILFFGAMVLLSREFGAKEKILKIIRFSAFFLVPVIALQIFAFKYFHFTSLDWYISSRPGIMVGKEGLLLVSFRWLGQIIKVLGILWPLFFIGLWRELRERNLERAKIYLALVPSSFSFLLWSVEAAGRSTFIFALLGIMLASCGCKKIRSRILVLIAAAMVILNYWFVSVNQEIPFTDIIYSVLE